MNYADRSRHHGSASTKWSVFGSVFDDMVSNAMRQPKEPLRREFFVVSEMVRQSVKFYLPHGSTVIGEKPYKELMELFELPFDCISILSESFVSETGSKDHPSAVKNQTLTIAFKPLGEFDKSIHWTPPHVEMPDDAWCYIVGLIEAIDSNCEPLWVISSPCHLLRKMEGQIGIQMIDTPYAKAQIARLSKHLGDSTAAVNRLHKEMSVDCDVLTNLCVLLALKNVQVNDVIAPKLVNAKRKKKGKTPLWSYHVLDVDGETWDAASGAGEGQEFRSHLRRGHVRRLVDGRRIWVRAAYVHGKAEGFVEKEYRVAP